MNHEHKVRLLEQSVIESNDGFPGSELVVREDWAQIITPHAKGSAGNSVYRSVFSESDAEEKVNAACDFYEGMQVPYRWVVTPLTQPSAIVPLIERRGLTLLYEATAMMQSVDLAMTPISEDLDIQEIELPRVNLYIDTFMQCWELPSAMRQEFEEGVVHGLKDPAKRFRPYVAFKGQEPIGTAALVIIPSGGYLAAGTVRKDQRGKGVYRALLSHRARVAKSLGLEHLLIHAKNHSAAPICKKLGFESIYQHKVYSKE